MYVCVLQILLMLSNKRESQKTSAPCHLFFVIALDSNISALVKTIKTNQVPFTCQLNLNYV